MFRTKITEMLGIEYPIVGGVLMWISTADFTAAISNAGGLGVLCSAMCPTPEEFSDALDRVRELTDKPFAVNLNLFPTKRPVDNSVYLDIMLDRGVKIVETSGHSAPEELSSRFKASGVIWMHKCVGVRYARKAQGLGADIITVVGYENGGHTGRLEIGTLVLVPRVRDMIDIPLVGGGGVADGRGLLAVLSLGADGVIVGTRLLLTRECPIHDSLKAALVDACETDTLLVMRSIGATNRVYCNEAAKKCLELEERKADLQEIVATAAGEKAKRMYERGAVNEGIMSCGQAVCMAHDIPTVKELFDRMIQEAGELSKRLNAG